MRRRESEQMKILVFDVEAAEDGEERTTPRFQALSLCHRIQKTVT